MPVVAKVEVFIFKLFHVIMRDTKTSILPSGDFPDFPPTSNLQSLYKEFFPTSHIKATFPMLAAQLEIGLTSLNMHFNIFSLDLASQLTIAATSRRFAAHSCCSLTKVPSEVVDT